MDTRTMGKRSDGNNVLQNEWQCIMLSIEILKCEQVSSNSAQYFGNKKKYPTRQPELTMRSERMLLISKV